MKLLKKQWNKPRRPIWHPMNQARRPQTQKALTPDQEQEKYHGPSIQT
jgi:hypothetical protein